MTTFGPRNRRKCRNAVCACTGDCFIEAKPQIMLDRLTDFMVEDILETSDEEIIQELIDDGIDPDVEAARIRTLIDMAVAKAKQQKLKG